LGGRYGWARIACSGAGSWGERKTYWKLVWRRYGAGVVKKERD